MIPTRALLIGLALTALPATAPAATASHARVSPAGRLSLPWIEDDYTRAVAEARARRVPLFIEAWAPW